MNDRRHDGTRARAGFTMVEVVVALVILAVGVLGLAGTTALVVRQVTLADVTTERANVLQSVVERLRAGDYDAMAAGSDNIGSFATSWTVQDYPRSKLVRIVTVGPGMVSGAGNMPYLSNAVADTFVYRIVEP